ncbi:hypothetical protein G6F65_019905 [Rhizopus arrhizus]|nr:hypothetical protein G6F65_019905 [Rhizopus arrhizus]
MPRQRAGQGHIIRVIESEFGALGCVDIHIPCPPSRSAIPEMQCAFPDLDTAGIGGKTAQDRHFPSADLGHRALIDRYHAINGKIVAAVEYQRSARRCEDRARAHGARRPAFADFKRAAPNDLRLAAKSGCR